MFSFTLTSLKIRPIPPVVTAAQHQLTEGSGWRDGCSGLEEKLWILDLHAVSYQNVLPTYIYWTLRSTDVKKSLVVLVDMSTCVALNNCTLVTEYNSHVTTLDTHSSLRGESHGDGFMSELVGALILIQCALTRHRGPWPGWPPPPRWS